MGGRSGGIRIESDVKRSKADIIAERYGQIAKAKADEAIAAANAIKDKPLQFHLDNGVSGEVEISKTDIKNITRHDGRSKIFDIVKNSWAKDIRGLLESSEYIGWSNVDSGKHTEVKVFVYYKKIEGVYDPITRKNVDCELYTCVRKMKHNGGKLKPYAIIDKEQFVKRSKTIQKGLPNTY